jgi:hypothetical protein
MVSQIDPTKPAYGKAYTADVRANFQYAHDEIEALQTDYLPLLGGNLLGPLTLFADPTLPLGASTKQYVDNKIAGQGPFLSLTGGTLTGPLVLAADPTLPLGASTKQYVDNKIAGQGPFLPLTGGTVTGGTTFSLPGVSLITAGTTNLGNTGIDNYLQVLPGNPDNVTLQLAGSGNANGAMILRSKGIGNVNIGGTIGGNTLVITPASIAATTNETLNLLQPTVAGNAVTLRNLANNMAANGGLSFQNMPVSLDQILVYSGTSTKRNNLPVQFNQTISGLSGNVGTAYPLNYMNTNYQNFQSGEVPTTFLIQARTLGGAAMRSAYAFAANIAQAAQTIKTTDAVMQWIPDHDFLVVGTLIVCNNLLWQLVTPGHSATTGTGPFGPHSFVGSTFTDGTCVWTCQDVYWNFGNLQSASFNTTAQYNVGGTSLTPVGQMWGMVIGVGSTSGATFWKGQAVLELDDYFQGSINGTTGIQVVKLGVNGSQLNRGIVIDGSQTQGYHNPFLIGRGLDDSGTAFAVEDQSQGVIQHGAGGVDFNSLIVDGVGPGGGGYYFRWQGGLIDKSSNVMLGYAGLRPTTTGLTIDSQRYKLTAVASIVNAGTGWPNGRIAKDQNGNIVTVTTDGNGHITSAAITVAGYMDTPPANPVTFYPLTTGSTVGPFIDYDLNTNAQFAISTFTANLTYTRSTDPNITLGAAGDAVRVPGTLSLSNALSGNLSVTGTTNLGTASSNWVQITGGANPLIQSAGPGSPALILRGGGAGSINLGSVTTGNVMQIVSGTANPGDLLQLLQPSALGSPYTFQSSLNNEASTGGISFKNMTVSLDQILTYGGTGNINQRQNVPFRANQIISGYSTNIGGAYATNWWLTTLQNIHAGEGMGGNVFQVRTGTGAAVRSFSAVGAYTSQMSQPLTQAQLQWQPTTAYTNPGQIVFNRGALWMLVTAGTSGPAPGPQGLRSKMSQNVNDGTCVWNQEDGDWLYPTQVAFNATATAGYNVGGTAALPVGNFWGATIGCGYIGAAAGYLNATVGIEVDDFPQTPVRSAVGIQVVKLGQSGYHQDMGVVVNGSLGSGQNMAYNNPFLVMQGVTKDGTAFAVEDLGQSLQIHMAGGLDFNQAIPDGNGPAGGGYYVRWGAGPNGAAGHIDAVGNIKQGFGATRATTTGLIIDARRWKFTGISAINNAGSGWPQPSTAKDQNGNVITINTDGAGHVTGIQSILVAGYVDTPPSGPVTFYPGSAGSTVGPYPGSPGSSLSAIPNDSLDRGPPTVPFTATLTYVQSTDRNITLGSIGDAVRVAGALTLSDNVSSTTTTLGDQLSLTKNYSTTMIGSPHQTVNTANITVPVAQELWNNFDDVNYNVAGGDTSTGTHVVARYTQVRKYTNSVNVPAMAFIASVVDFTNQRSSVAGPLTGYELDLECAGPDDQTAFGPNGSRVGMTMNFYPARGYAGNDSQVNAAYAVFGDTARVSFKRLFNGSAAWSVAAIDLGQGVQLTNAVTILMNAGMRIRFNTNRDLYWDNALFSAAGGFHLTGKLQVDELLYSPAGFTSGGPITFSGTVTHSAAYNNTLATGMAFTVASNASVGGTFTMCNASANYFVVSGAPNNPQIVVTGTGTNGSFLLRAQGNGSVNIGSATGGNGLQVSDGGGGTLNTLQIVANVAGTPTIIRPLDAVSGIQINATAGGKIGFNAATPIGKYALTGAKGSNTALASVIALLVSYGLATDGTTA